MLGMKGTNHWFPCQAHCAQITFQSVVAGKFALSGSLRIQAQLHMSTIDLWPYVCV